MDKLRVEYDDLDTLGNDGGYGYIMGYKGERYTGIAISRFESGHIELEEEFIDGFNHGKQIYYFENGQIDEEFFSKWGQYDGELKAYYETGEVKEIRYYELGTMLRGRDFDKNGYVIKEYPETFKALTRLRNFLLSLRKP